MHNRQHHKSIRPLPPQHDADGADEQRDVLPEAPVADVPGIEAQAPVELDIVAPADLPQARDARRRHADDVVVVADLLPLTRQIRTRPHEAHLPAQHVENLRQLIDIDEALAFSSYTLARQLI